MAETIHFNTARKYTAFGQRITATRHDDGIVTFFDHDRKIDGEYTDYFPEMKLDRDGVMQMYDSRAYKNTTRSYEDGMMRGGCNSTYVEEKK